MGLAISFVFEYGILIKINVFSIPHLFSLLCPAKISLLCPRRIMTCFAASDNQYS